MRLLLLAIMTCGSAFPVITVMSPQVAFADDASAEEVISRANDLKAKISDSQAKYLAAVSDRDLAEAERDEAQEQEQVLSQQLDDERNRLSQLMSNAYSKSSASAADVITGAGTIGDIIRGIDSYNRIECDVTDSTNAVASLHEQQQAKVAECEQKVQVAQDAADAAERQHEQFESDLADMGDEIRQVSSALSAEILATPSRSAQLQSLLDYMNNVYDITSTQERIITAAYKTSYAGGMRCEAWVENAYRNAGIAMRSYMSAYDDYKANCKSTSTEDIKAGALVYGSGSGTIWAHVGIALTDSMGENGMSTLILDNEGTRTGVTTLGEWLAWQKNPCPRNGKAGWFGWGYPSGVNLG